MVQTIGAMATRLPCGHAATLSRAKEGAEVIASAEDERRQVRAGGR